MLFFLLKLCLEQHLQQAYAVHVPPSVDFFSPIQVFSVSQPFVIVFMACFHSQLSPKVIKAF